MIKNPPIIRRVVKEMGGKFKEIIPERGYYKIIIRGKEIPLCIKFRISGSPLMGAEETKYKDITYYLLKKESIPTPKTVCFYRKRNESRKEMEKKLSSFKFPIIIKDAEGSQSKGVYPNIENSKTAIKIIKEAFKTYPRMVAQSMVFGNEYRVTVLGDRVIAALRMIPPRVTGNGKESVEKLMEKKQKNTRKQTPKDGSLKKILKEQGFSLKSVPAEGEVIYLRRSSALAEGGETEDVTDVVHEDIKKYCVKATFVTGKRLAGLDIICENISTKPNKRNFSVIEVNGRPDIYIHYNPTYGRSRNVVKDIINFIVENNIGQAYA